MINIDRLELDEEVIVIKPNTHCYDKIGTVWKITQILGGPKISVCFDGEVYNFKPEDLTLA